MGRAVEDGWGHECKGREKGKGTAIGHMREEARPPTPKEALSAMTAARDPGRD